MGILVRLKEDAMKIMRPLWHVLYLLYKPKSKVGIAQMLCRKYGWRIDIHPTKVVKPVELKGVPCHRLDE